MSKTPHRISQPRGHCVEQALSPDAVRGQKLSTHRPSQFEGNNLADSEASYSEALLQQPTEEPAGPFASHELLSHISSLRVIGQHCGRSAILSNGGGAFAVQLAEYLGNATVVSPNVKFIRLAKTKPLGSGSAVRRYLDITPTRPFGTVPYVLRSGLTYRTGSLDRTSLPSSTFSFVVIEQGQFGNLRSTLAEACRIARSGGTILLVSYANMRVIAKARPPKDEILVSHINGLLQSHMISFLNPFLTFDEQLFRMIFEPPIILCLMRTIRFLTIASG